jgi:hypothetical protein
MYMFIVLLGMLFFFRPIVESTMASFCIIGVIRFFSSTLLFYKATSFSLFMVMMTENFPLEVQASCAGIVEGVAQLGTFMGPVVITLSIDFQIYPVIVLSFIVFLTVVIPTWFLREKKAEEFREDFLDKMAQSSEE